MAPDSEEPRTETQGAYARATGAGGVGAGGYGRVILTIKSAHNLRDRSSYKIRLTFDPYVEVSIAGATISTHHISDAGESVTFEESFAFNNVAPDDVMSFHVYDKKNLGRDTLMGEGSITLREVFESGSMETRVPLTTRFLQQAFLAAGTSGTKDSGEIWISMKLENGAGTQKVGYETGAAAGISGYEGNRTTGKIPAIAGEEYFTKVEDR